MRNGKIRKCPVLNEQAEVNTGICLNKSLKFPERKKEFSKFQKQKNSKQIPTRKPN